MRFRPIFSCHERYALTISTAGKSLLTLLNDILDLSRVEAGRFDLVEVALDPESILAEARSMFSHAAAEKGLKLQCLADPGSGRGVMCDETRLRQVVFNLVTNALKFTEEGSVTLSYDLRPNDDDGERMDLTLTVADTGIGIPAEEQARIFEAFRQREGQSASLGGTGLGLAICRRMTEAMGGRISGVTI